MTAGSIVAELGAEDPSAEPVAHADELPEEQSVAQNVELMVPGERHAAAEPPPSDRVEAKETAARERAEAEQTRQQQAKQAKEADRQQREQAKLSKAEAKQTAARERAEAEQAKRRQRKDAKETEARERAEAKQARREQSKQAKETERQQREKAKWSRAEAKKVAGRRRAEVTRKPAPEKTDLDENLREQAVPEETVPEPPASQETIPGEKLPDGPAIDTAVPEQATTEHVPDESVVDSAGSGEAPSDTELTPGTQPSPPSPAAIMDSARLASKREVAEHERAERQERAREEEQEAKDQRAYARREARREREEAKAAARREHKEAKEAKQEARREAKEAKQAERRGRGEAKQAQRHERDKAKESARTETEKARTAARLERAGTKETAREELRAAKQTKLAARQLSSHKGKEPAQNASDVPVSRAVAAASSVPEVDARTMLKNSDGSADDMSVPPDSAQDVAPVPEDAEREAARRANEEWNAERERVEAAAQTIPQPDSGKDDGLLAADSDPAPELRDSKAESRELAETKEAARRGRQQAKVEADDSRSTRHAKDDDDHIVEAPRGPKVSLTERRRQKAVAKRSSTTVEPKRRKDPEAANSRTEGRNRGLVIAAGILGAVGLVCSVILAIGAFLVAIGTTEGNTVFDVVSNISDALVGPLRGLFTFGGAKGDMKEALVAWGIGSMVYVAVGVAAQSFVRSRSED